MTQNDKLKQAGHAHPHAHPHPPAPVYPSSTTVYPNSGTPAYNQYGTHAYSQYGTNAYSQSGTHAVHGLGDAAHGRLSPASLKACGLSGPIKVNWQASKPALIAKWGLADADLNLAEGTYEELFARIAKRTGQSEADIAATLATLPGFGPAPDWDAVRTNLRTKWPTLTEADLAAVATGSRDELIGMVKNRTAENRDAIAAVVDEVMASATATVEAAKAEIAQAAVAARTGGVPHAHAPSSQSVKLRQRWPALTDADLDETQSQEELVAAVQKRTGEPVATVEKAVKNAR